MERIRLASYIRSGPTVFGIPLAARSQVSRALFRAALAAWNRGEHPGVYTKPTQAFFNEFVSEQRPEIRQIPAFLIDARPVSVREFLKFWQEASRCGLLNETVEDDRYWSSYKEKCGDRLDEPVTGVTHEEASLFCIAHGGHLPSIGELFRIIRKGRLCKDLMDPGTPCKARWSITGLAPAKIVSSTLQANTPRRVGVTIDWCDEWTRSLIAGDSEARDPRYQEYRVLRTTSNSPFPLLEFGAGYSGRWWIRKQRAIAHRYTSVGFRCRYQIAPDC